LKSAKAQGGFEYILLIAGMAMVVVVAVLVAMGSTDRGGNILKSQGDSYGNYVSGVLTITPKLSGPDLAILGTNNTGCSSNEFKAWVQNIGDQATPSAPIGVRFQGNESVYEIVDMSVPGPLGQGEVAITSCGSFTLSSPTGYNVTVDFDGQVPEIIESNNAMNGTVAS
jgi:hypothetical protein